MANKLRGSVDVELGKGSASARTVTLYFGINEMIALQEEMGVEEDHRFLALLSERVQSMAGLRMAVRHMLLALQPETTLADAGRIIDELGDERAVEVITKVFERVRPAAVPGDAPGKATARSPGTTPS